jgi:hypothetical protein
LKTTNFRIFLSPVFVTANKKLQFRSHGSSRWLDELAHVPGQQRALHDWTDLDDTVKCRWGPGCPRDRCVEIGYLKDMKTTQLLFRVGIGAVEHLVLPFVTRTVVADAVGCSPLLLFSTPAFVIASI